MLFNSTGCQIKRNVIATGSIDRGLFKLDIKTDNSALACHASANAMLWHRRLGRINFKCLGKLKKWYGIRPKI